MSNDYILNKSYISLPVDLDGLPDETIIDGVKLIRKTSFHVSLVCVKNLINKYGEGIKEKVFNLFNSFVETNPITFVGYKNEFRLAKRSDGRISLVVMVNVSNLSEFFKLLRKELDIDVDDQPTHITLYTLKLDEGIGINNKDDLAKLTTVVEAPNEVKKVFSDL